MRSGHEAEAPKNVEDIVKLLAEGHYRDAEGLARNVLRQAEGTGGPDSVQVAAVIDVLVEALYRGGKAKKPEARALAERSVVIKKKTYGEDHLETATSLSRLGRVFFLSGNETEARRIFEQVLAIRETSLRPEDPRVAAAVYDLAELRWAAQELSAARPLFERALTIQTKALGPDHPDVATTLNGLGYLILDTDDYGAARRIFTRALAIREKALGPDHPDVATSAKNLGLVLHYTGEYAAARALYERSLAIREKALGPDHPDVANSLNNLANLSCDMGDYAPAKPMYERALAIREKAFGPDDPEVAWTLTFLGSFYRLSGDYTSARSTLERALAISEKALDPETQAMANVLESLGLLLSEMGDYDAAKPLFERSLAIREITKGPDHDWVANNLKELASLLCKTGDYGAARPMLERAISIQEVYGPDHECLGRTLHNLAELEFAVGDFAAARRLFERALAIRKKARGPDHPEVAASLNGLATVLLKAGEPAAARSRFERALAIREKAVGADHPLVAESLAGLAESLAAIGEKRLALRTTLRAETIAWEHVRLTVRTLSEDQALRYSQVRASGLDLAVSLVTGRDGQTTAGPSGDAAEKAWDALVRSRALVLDEMASRKRSVVETADPETGRLAVELATARARLANLTVRGPGKVTQAQYRRMLDEARGQKTQAERALANRSVVFRQQLVRSEIGLREVRRSMPAGSALVAFVEYRQRETDATTAQGGHITAEGRRSDAPLPKTDGVLSYAAFVLAGGSETIQLVHLGRAEDIDELVSAWSEEAAQKDTTRRTPADRETAYRKTGEALRRNVWDPVASLVKDSKLVLIVPDGALHLVSFASLPIGQEAYLLETGPLVHHLSAERDLVRDDGPRAHGSGLLALGNPAFNEASLFGALDGGQEKQEKGVLDKLASFLTIRRGSSDCRSFESLRFGPLPSSAAEISEVAELWTKAGPLPGKAVLLLTGSEANETAFKAAAPGKRILHLSTHGFFLGGTCALAQGSPGVGGLRQADQGQSFPVAGVNPLLLSGLALAGANHRREAGPDEDDGVLTAEEISALNLSGVEWAVLSACDTGVGEVKAGEGVFGLRRAFEIAGARSLIMSLWPVDDAATREWMRNLYEARLVRGLGTAEAVREASVSVLRARRAKGRSTHPFTWAAFIGTGDWK